MKVNVFIRIFTVLLVALFTLSGCSYVQFEEGLKSSLNDLKPERDQFEGYVFIAEETPEESDDSESVSETKTESGKNEKRIIYSTFDNGVIAVELLDIGDSCSGVYKYSNSKGDVVTLGQEGVSYTLKGVEVYDSYFDSSYTDYGWFIYTSEVNERVVKMNAFIVAEITVKYEAPDDSEENKRIPVHIDTRGFRIEEKVDDNGYMRTADSYSYPVQVWFSDPPTEEDAELDPLKDNCSIMINDGEERTVKIGYFANHELVESKNVFITFGYIKPSIKGSITKMFEIFPDENNDKYKEMPQNVPLTLVEPSAFGEIEKVRISGNEVDAITKSVGDKLPAFRAYRTRLSDEIMYMGDNGLYISVDKIKVYDSFADSGLNSQKLYYYTRNKELENSKFILVDITAEYIAPEGGEKTIKSYANLATVRYTMPNYDSYDRATKGFCTPTVVWYSGDHGEKHDFTAYTISDGEKYHYQLGILAAPEYIENHNVNLEICPVSDRNVLNEVYQLIELFPEE